MTKLQIVRFVLTMAISIVLLGALAVVMVGALSWPVALIIGLLATAFFIQSRYFKRRNERRGWRMRSVRKGEWAYEERRAGAWVGIPFAEFSDPKESPRVIGIPGAASWGSFPGWASTRRDEIVDRIQSELKAPEYTFTYLDQAPPHLPDAPASEPPRLPPEPKPGE